MKQSRLYQPHTSSLGNLNANVAVLLCCLALLIFGFWGFVFSVVIIAIERKSAFVKYSVTQAGLAWALLWVVSAILNLINGSFSLFGFSRVYYWNAGSALVSFVSSIVGIARVVLLILLAVKGYKWELPTIPGLSHIAEIIARTGTAPLYDGEGPVPPECQPVPNQPGTQSYTGYQGPPPQSTQAPGQGAWQPPQQSPQGQAWQPQPPQGPAGGATGQNASPHAPQPGPQTYAPAPPPQPVQSQPVQPVPGYNAPAQPQSDPNQQLPKDMRDAPRKDME